jgi:hypothetical protein
VKSHAGPLVRLLEGTLSDVTFGGGGRYLLLTLKDDRKLAVFDINAVDVVKTIPLPSSNVLVAAGAKTFLIAFPDEKLIQRWDLETLARDGGNQPLAIDGRLIRLALGSDSDGPALAAWSPNATGTHPETRFSFIDPNSLKVLRVQPSADGGSFHGGTLSASGGSFTVAYISDDRPHLRASAGGGLFGMWSSRLSPSGFVSLIVDGKLLKATHLHESFGHVVPGPDGRSLFTGYVGRVDQSGKPPNQTEVRTRQGNEMTIPSTDPSYYLSVPRQSTPNSPGGPVTAAIHLTGDDRRVLTVAGLNEMASAAGNGGGKDADLTVEKRFHLVPAANLLITIPPSNDRLVLRRLDLAEMLEQQLGDYLLATSPAFLTVEADREFEHQVEVKARKGPVTYVMNSGPEGMVVSPAGKVTWKAAPNRRGREVAAVLTIGDATGQEIFHTIRIRIR